jgi:agmatine deiminase
VGWGFNAWAKYPNWKKDCRLPRRIARELKLPLVEPRIKRSLDHKVILEGGSIDVNGQGTLLTTEECLLSRAQQRNPGMSRQQWERLFAEYLAVRKVIWLGAGIAGDDTHGHVDDIARFVGPRTVAAAVERDPTDVNYKPLRENLRRLRRAKDQAGRQLEILELPMPSPVIFKGQRLPASYANFYIANAAVLVPVFNDANDRIALELLQRVFRKRKVVGIYCGDLIWGFGAIHCMTQQQPA